MTVFSMMGAFRFVLVHAEGPVVLWEFAGCEHLAEGAQWVTQVRTAPNVTPAGGSHYAESTDGFARDVVDLIAGQALGRCRLAIERFDHHVTDALRARGCEPTSATEVFALSRSIKTPQEVEAMRHAMGVVTAALDGMRDQIEPGRTEVEVWAELHRGLIARNGEFISTRLAQTGARTFPYFNEAGTTPIRSGDLFCVDTDAIGPGGYAVDFSRTFVCAVTADPRRTSRASIRWLWSSCSTMPRCWHRGAVTSPLPGRRGPCLSGSRRTATTARLMASASPASIPMFRSTTHRFRFRCRVLSNREW